MTQTDYRFFTEDEEFELLGERPKTFAAPGIESAPIPLTLMNLQRCHSRSIPMSFGAGWRMPKDGYRNV